MEGCKVFGLYNSRYRNEFVEGHNSTSEHVMKGKMIEKSCAIEGMFFHNVKS